MPSGKLYSIFLPAFVVLRLFLLSAPLQCQVASVLREGAWYKIAVSAEGIYRIDRSTLSALGINPNTTDPGQVRVFGSSSGMLPQLITSQPISDLEEVAVVVAGDGDGRFDANDHILFYAQGPHRVFFQSNGLFAHEFNLYDERQYFFIRVDNRTSLRVDAAEAPASATTSISTYQDYLFHEKDETNIIRSGRFWFGERFDFVSERNFRFTVPGMVEGSRLALNVSVMAQATVRSSFTGRLNGRELGSISINEVPDFVYARKGNTAQSTFFSTLESVPANGELNLTLTYNRPAVGNAFAHLDFIGLNVERRLQLYGNSVIFTAPESRFYSAVNYIVANADSDTRIWEVHQPLRPRAYQSVPRQGGVQFSAFAGANQLRRFVVFRGSDYPRPEALGSVANQNLHSMATPDLLIVSHPNFMDEAYRLASFRERNDKLKVEVVSTLQVYNEFSAGRADISAIRNFARHLYRPSRKLRYLLLVGDASYDYKNRTDNNTNFVPTYQSRESLHPIFSFSSDDYFGFLNEGEGNWAEDFPEEHQLSIGIGRLPVKSVQEARNVVNKLIHYTTTASMGNWRKTLCFIADDEDFNIHVNDAELLAGKAAAISPMYNINKIYIDAFPQVLTANGKRSPATRDAINRQIQEGTLIMNYTGHGAETGWASEGIVDIVQINRWTNINRLPLMLTATCEFGRFDNPELTSGAEFALINARGGAIGLLTTTRPVFSSTNFILNDAFYEAVFKPISGQMPRLGDVQRITKNNSINGVVNRNFTLLGDPSMRLAYPEQEVVINNIRSSSSPEGTLQAKALDKVSLSGAVHHNGNINTSFNGTAEIIVYDKISTLRTLGDESEPIDFRQYTNVLYRGKATVQNGTFEVNFVIPKDIDYREGNGRISLYASDTLAGNDAAGIAQQFRIGGTALEVQNDNTPPSIRLYMDNEQFTDGGIVLPDTRLLAFFSDESGINISSQGIGREIRYQLNNEREGILNAFYRSAIDDFSKGSLEYPFSDLEEGPYTIRVKAWDTHNNQGEASLSFRVVKEAFAIKSFNNYPNPFSNFTNFRLSHNKAGENLEISLIIYNTLGQLVHQQERFVFNSRESIEDITWDGTSSDGRKQLPGVYIYQINVKLSDVSVPQRATQSGRVLLVH